MTDTSEGKAKQWMEDVNEQLDGLMDDVTSLQGKNKTTMMVAGAAIVLGAVQSLGIATLFKGQKAIVETLSAVVNRLEPAPMSAEDVARAQAAMHPTVVVDNHNGVEPDRRIVTNTEVPSEAATPVDTPASESPDWVKEAMAKDPSWEELGDLT